jgi:hypothetical protein
MSWYSASICSSTDKLYTLIYTRDYDLLSLMIEALKKAGVSEISERPVDGWICAYCGALNKDNVTCVGCAAKSPVPLEGETQ